MTTEGNGTRNGANIVQVRFLHPRDSSEFKAEISEQATGAKVVECLIKEKFLDQASTGHTYVLQSQRTGATIPMSSSLVDAGVKDKDIVAVVRNAAGEARIQQEEEYTTAREVTP